MKKIALYLGTLIVLVLLLVASLTLFQGSHPAVHATITGCQGSETSCLDGWAWSSDIGWVSFNSNDTGANGGFGYDVAISTSTGNFSGYAWSANIGWISFNSVDVTACNGGTGSAVSVNLSTGQTTGWARVISEVGRNDGWDGCIGMSDNTYFKSPDLTGNGGVTYNKSTGFFLGNAWSGQVLGWLKFTPSMISGGGSFNASTTICGSLPSYPCPGIGPGPIMSTLSLTGTSGYYTSASTLTVPLNASITMNWNVQNLQNCQTTGQWNNWSPVGSPIPIGLSSPSFTNGYGTVSYSSAGTYTPTLTCDIPNSGLPAKTMIKTVTITVNNVTMQQTLCSAPSHGILCSSADYNIAYPIGQTAPYGVSACASPEQKFCSFQCDIAKGYKLVGGICTKSSLQEI